MPSFNKFEISKFNATDDVKSGLPFSNKIGLILIGLIVIGVIGFIGFKAINKLNGGAKISLIKPNSYRTISKVELKEAKASSSPIVAVLKEGTVVSGKSVGQVDGIEWAEITSVDAVHGFLPMSSLQKIGEGADLSQVQDVQRRVVASTSINLRAMPSLSGNIIGTIDGGTRLLTDGYVSSQGEDWLRLRVGRDTTGFIMARFTTPDDDRAGSSEGFYGADVGVQGTAKIVTNVQATPFPDGRIIKSLLAGDKVGVIGQTKADDYWYIIRMSDGTQGFVPKNAISVYIKEVKAINPEEAKLKNAISEQGAQTNTLPSADNPVEVQFDNGEKTKTEETPAPVPNPAPEPKTDEQATPKQ